MVDDYPKIQIQGPIECIGNAYAKFLNTIDWEDQVYLNGIKEGRGKFLSNAWLYECVNGFSRKYYNSHFISEAALSVVKPTRNKGLIIEHLVPKQVYIQNVCEEKSKAGEINPDFIHDLLNRYWALATITKTEDKLLESKTMPKNWDGIDIFSRYRMAGIHLVHNPHFNG